MDIKQLRIGNLFLDYAGVITKVTPKVFTDIESGGWKDATFLPLSEDILLKMGFSDTEYNPGFIGIDVGNTDFVLNKPSMEGKDVTLDNFSFHFSYGGWSRYRQFKYTHDLQTFSS